MICGSLTNLKKNEKEKEKKKKNITIVNIKNQSKYLAGLFIGCLY